MADQVIVFDVHETLLDLAVLDPIFTDVLGAAAVRGGRHRSDAGGQADCPGRRPRPTGVSG